MTKERKIRKPKTPTGLKVKLETIRYKSGVRLNMETLAGPKGQYNSVVEELEFEASVPEEMDRMEAMDDLKTFLHECLDEAAQEQVAHWLEVLGLKSKLEA